MILIFKIKIINYMYFNYLFNFLIIFKSFLIILIYLKFAYFLKIFKRKLKFCKNQISALSKVFWKVWKRFFFKKGFHFKIKSFWKGAKEIFLQKVFPYILSKVFGKCRKHFFSKKVFCSNSCKIVVIKV